MGIRRACSARSGHGLLSINRVGKSAGPNQSEVAARWAATNAPENPTKTEPPKITVIFNYGIFLRFKQGEFLERLINRAGGSEGAFEKGDFLGWKLAFQRFLGQLLQEFRQFPAVFSGTGSANSNMRRKFPGFFRDADY